MKSCAPFAGCPAGQPNQSSAYWLTPNRSVIATLSTASNLSKGTDANLAPKVNGTNVEGLTWAPTAARPSQLLIGFRNPGQSSSAIIVSLLNADAVLSGATASFGEATLLDLGGLGIRAMTWSAILAGSLQSRPIVLRFLRWLVAAAASGVILLPHPRACCAAETTQRGVTAAVFAGTGSAEDANNEGASNEYDLHRVGGGLLGVVRVSRSHAPVEAAAPSTPESPPTPSSSVDRDRGFFAQVGATAEVEWWKQTQCGAFCAAGTSFVPGPYQASHKLGWRLGAGFSFSAFEFRAGLLQVLPSQDSIFPTRFLFPDVVLRFGRRSIGWFELGLGAYDASTSLRPGLYIGGGGFPLELVRVSAHAGVHLTQGICCQTVGIGAGGVAEVSLDHAFATSVVGGVGVMYNGAFEGNAHVSLLL